MFKTANILAVATVAAFLLFNAFKIALFNNFLIQNRTAENFLYKFGMILLIVVIIYPLIYKLKSRALLIAAYILQSIYIIVNLSYYLFFHNYLHIMQYITLFSEAISTASKSAIPFFPQMLIIFIDLPFFAYIIFRKHRIKLPWAENRHIAILAVIVPLLMIISVETGNYIRNKSIMQIMHDTYSGESPIVERYGTVVNNLVGIYLNNGGKELIGRLKYGREQINDEPALINPNFIIIQVESMDSAIISQKYKGS